MNTHYEFKYGFAENGQSICSINEKLNCESVSISPYSYFLGLPLATWGMAFHLAFLFLFGLLITQPSRQESISRFIKLFATLSLAATLVMGTVAFTMMSAYCIFCITLYVLSILNFAILAKHKEISFFPNKEDLRGLFKTGESGLVYVLFAFIAIPAVAFLGHDMGSRGFIQKSTFMINDSLNEWERAPVETFTTPMLVEGSKNPKFTIVEFADFQCIHCKDAVYNLHSFVNSKPDVQLQFYSFPLDGNCNPALGSGGNGKSCILAKATYCAEKQGKGWKAHGWIFDRFGTDENSNFESMSKDLDLDYTALNTCIQSDEASAFITSQAKLGQQVKVEGTPTIFINGKKLPGGNIIAVLEALYKKLSL
jgi:uncharacterized membrane protein